MTDVLITTMNDLPGYEVEEVYGEVFGLTVRSRNIGSQMGAGLKSLVGGELKGMTKQLAEGRAHAQERLEEEARSKGANAVIAFRFDTSELGSTWTEICAYGTAVRVRRTGAPASALRGRRAPASRRRHSPELPAERPYVHVDSVEELRAWLEANHETSDGALIVTWKKDRGPYVSWSDVVPELLAHGWIDSKSMRFDEDRRALTITPRKPKSEWSRRNKEIIETLTAEGRMTPAGQAMVELAKETGTWNALDSVEALEEPPELAAALDADPAARDELGRVPALGQAVRTADAPPGETPGDARQAGGGDRREGRRGTSGSAEPAVSADVSTRSGPVLRFWLTRLSASQRSCRLAGDVASRSADPQRSRTPRLRPAGLEPQACASSPATASAGRPSGAARGSTGGSPRPCRSRWPARSRLRSARSTAPGGAPSKPAQRPPARACG